MVSPGNSTARESTTGLRYAVSPFVRRTAVAPYGAH